jgi:hypothetical protein
MILLGAAALTACNAQKLTADEARGALPYAENVQVGTPDSSAAVAAAVVPYAVSNSDYFRLTRALAASVNGGVGLLLGTIRFVVSLPPTSCKDDTCTWGPGSQPTDYNIFMLTVTRSGDEFDWALSAEPKSNPAAGFTRIIYGTAFPGAAPRRGHGSVTVDFDAAKALDGPHDDDGHIDCQYDARGPLSLACQFVNMLDSDPTAVPGSHIDAAYDFQASTSGGDLQVAWATLPPTAAATLSIHSRWDTTGAGRGDVQFVMGGTYQASECWGPGTTAFALVYDTDPAFGDENSCAFIPAAYATIAAPAP